MPRPTGESRVRWQEVTAALKKKDVEKASEEKHIVSLLVQLPSLVPRLYRPNAMKPGNEAECDEAAKSVTPPVHSWRRSRELMLGRGCGWVRSGSQR